MANVDDSLSIGLIFGGIIFFVAVVSFASISMLRFCTEKAKVRGYSKGIEDEKSLNIFPDNSIKETNENKEKEVTENIIEVEDESRVNIPNEVSSFGINENSIY